MFGKKHNAGRTSVNHIPVIYILLLAVIIVTVLPLTSLAHSDGDVTGTVRVGFFDFGGMFEGASDDSVKSGYCYEYMMRIATYTGWNYEFVYGTYSELYELLRRGEIDILPYTNYNDQRGTEVLFSDKALAEEEYYLVVLQNDACSPEDLNGKVISTLEGADYNELLTGYLENRGIEADIRYYPDLEGTWDAVRSGEVFATVFTSNAYDGSNWSFVDNFGKKPTYIAVSADRPDLLSRLNDATSLIDIDYPALLGELYSEYFSDNPMRRTLSQEEQHWLEDHPVLHVGGFTNDAPYLFSVDGDTGRATGLTVDVVNGIIDRLDLGISADFRAYASLGELEAAMERGEIDVIIPYYPDQYLASRHGLVISKTVRVSNMELVFRRGTSYSEALKKIATPSTRLGIYYVRDIFPSSDVLGAVSVQEAVDMVRDGRASGAVAQNIVLHSIKEKYSDLDYIVLAEGCSTCFAARSENYPVIRILNRGLNYFTQAEIASISSLYTLDPEVTTKAYLATHREAVILLVLILVILVILAAALIQLGHMKRKADEASRSKTTFLFNMSHDIRTPMNAITGFTQIAKKNAGNEEKVREYLDKIDISGQQLLTLVNQILEMARIESGKIELDEKPVNILREFEHSTTVLAEQAEASGLTFRCSAVDIVHEHLFADPARMSSVTLNITGNAMKYTPRGGAIDYTIREIPPRKDGYATVVFTVEDTGIGMSEEYLKVIYEPFSREKNSTVSKIQGAGLGMSIVKNLVDLMGGSIEVRSEQGKGTRFDITLDFRIDDSPEITGEDTSVPGQLPFAGRKVLLVEDNMMNREIATDILEDAGLEVEEADDGTVAVKLLREKGPCYYDIILMDIQMPVMNGYEATRAIREMYPDRHIPIVALSANAFAEDRATSIAAGMDDHVAKPIDVSELLETMKRLCS